MKRRSLSEPDEIERACERNRGEASEGGDVSTLRLVLGLRSGYRESRGGPSTQVVKGGTFRCDVATHQPLSIYWNQGNGSRHSYAVPGDPIRLGVYTTRVCANGHKDLIPLREVVKNPVFGNTGEFQSLF